MAHDADHHVAGAKAAFRRRLDDAPERLVAEHQALAPRGRLAIVAVDELPVGAADAHGERAYQERALLLRRLGNLVQPLRGGLAGDDGDSAHTRLTAPRRP